MAKPNQPRDIKPKNDNNNQNTKQGINIQLILVNIISTILICSIFLFANYYIQNNLLSQKLPENTEEIEPETMENEQLQRGVLFELGDFTMNLADQAPRRYLKVSVAIEVTPLEKTDITTKEKSGGGHSSGHGSSSTAPNNDEIDKEMAPFKPAIRDAIINALSSKTSDELSSITGKEIAKEQISQSIDSIFEGEREVLRVSFGQFIIQ